MKYFLMICQELSTVTAKFQQGLRFGPRRPPAPWPL